MYEMTKEQVLLDLIDRLEHADRMLQQSVKGRTSELGFDVTRIEGKAEGVRLALSYVREY